MLVHEISLAKLCDNLLMNHQFFQRDYGIKKSDFLKIFILGEFTTFHFDCKTDTIRSHID